MGKIRLDKRTGYFVGDYKDASGNRVRRKLSRDRRKATETLTALEGQAISDRRLGIRPLKQASFEKFAEEFIKHAREHVCAWKRYESSLVSLKKFFGNRDLSAIEPTSIEQYKLERAEKVERSTVNRDLQCLRRMCNLAIIWGYLRATPMRGVKMFPESAGRMRYLTCAEFDRLIEHCPEHLKSIVMVAVHTGMRQGELLKLTWSDIDFENGFASVNDPKNKTPRKTPLNDAAKQALQAIPAKSSSRVFTDADGQPLPARTLQDQFPKAVASAKIESFRFHDLRHTCASWMAMAGVPILSIKDVLGHKDIRMTMRYSHLSPSQGSDAVKRLDEFAKSKSAKRGLRAAKVQPAR